MYVQYHMRRYSEMIINMMKTEKLFYPQGGPIIMAQVSQDFKYIILHMTKICVV